MTTIITKDQAKQAIENKEFPNEIINKPKAAVILTQDWCPDWKGVESWIDDVNEVDIFVFIYDNTFPEFMNFKENVLNNNLIPYIRYYKDGKLIDETNQISKNEFLKKFD